MDQPQAKKVNTEHVEDAYFTPYSAGFSEIKDQSGFVAYASVFNLVSPSVRSIIFDFSTAEFIEERLGTRFELNNGQKKELANLIRELLLGNIFMGDFTQMIQVKLGLDPEKSKNVASMLIGELFVPALESIKATQRIKFPQRIEEMKKASQVQQATPQQPKPTATPFSPSVSPTTPKVFQSTTLPKPPKPPQGSRPPIAQAKPFVNSGIVSQIKTPSNPPPLPAQPIPQPTVGPASPAPQLKPLDKELERVANIIDLRNKPKE